MAKQVRYMAEVVNYGKNKEKVSSFAKKYFPIGKQLCVTRIEWKGRMAFSAYDPTNKDLSIFGLLSKCAHLNGGSWKLMPYEIKKKERK